MTIEERILNEAIDYSFIEDNYLEYDDCGDTCDDRDFIQKAFESGAKWMQKKMIDKACECIIKLQNWPTHYEEFSKLQEEFITAFRKEMEE